jgi:hypothetical protein
MRTLVPIWRPARRVRSSLAAPAAGTAFAAVLWLASGLAPALARDGDRASERTVRRTFAVPAGQDLHFDLAWGELQIEPTDSAAVEVVVSAECRRDGERCRRRLSDIDVSASTRRQRLEIEVTGMSKWETAKAQVRIVVRVPRRHGLSVAMGAGECVVEGLASDLKVDLGAGEIRVRMPEDAVRSADLSAGVGETTLRLGDGEVAEHRSHLVGSTVRWDEGAGEARLELHVGAGEVDVRLD